MRVFLAALLALAASSAAAQYPDRPMTMLAGYPPGGKPSTDSWVW